MQLSAKDLKPGQKVKITQTVRVGIKSWQTTVEGVVRDVQLLVTGTTVDRAPDDFVGVPTVHFTKLNGELSSITVDERTRIELVAS